MARNTTWSIVLPTNGLVSRCILDLPLRLHKLGHRRYCGKQMTGKLIDSARTPSIVFLTRCAGTNALLRQGVWQDWKQLVENSEESKK